MDAYKGTINKAANRTSLLSKFLTCNDLFFLEEICVMYNIRIRGNTTRWIGTCLFNIYILPILVRPIENKNIKITNNSAFIENLPDFPIIKNKERQLMKENINTIIKTKYSMSFSLKYMLIIELNMIISNIGSTINLIEFN